jgi:hypothetical protein
MAMFIKDIEDSQYAREMVYRVNNMLDEPLSENEIKKTIERRL